MTASEGTAMDNKRVAAIFNEMADLLEIKGGQLFRIRAFRRVAEAIEELPDALISLIETGTLAEVPGVGKGAVRRIEEIIETGDCADHKKLRDELPPGILELLSVSGIGPKTVKLVFDELGIGSIDALEAAARAGHLASLPRMGEKSQAKILKAIDRYRARTGRIPLTTALPQGLAVVSEIASEPSVIRADLAGSSRRRRESIGDLDILAASDDAPAVMDRLVALPQIDEVLLRGDTKCSVRLRSGIQLDLRVVPEASYGAASHYFTGSQMHNIAIRDRAKRRGLRINEYGVFTEPAGERIAGATEEEVFAAVDLPYIPPELREDRGELEAAEAGKLPRLIGAEDLQGDLHTHSKAGGGAAAPSALARAAKALDYRYLAVTDRLAAAANSTVSTALDPAGLARRRKQLMEISEQVGIRLLNGAEVAITADGAVPGAESPELEWVIATVAAVPGMDREATTDRIIRAFESGLIDCLAHPTGRVLGEQPGIDLDLERLLQAAARTGVAMELNADPRRLDLDAPHCRMARDLGCLVALNSDAYHPKQLAAIEFGVYTARRGWLAAKDVLNAQPLETVLQHRAHRRRG